MKRLMLKKLIVVSQSEAKSLEVPFVAGLNIILGENKTGKSSIIKSIFTTFGCKCPKVETEWKKLISEYILFFSVNDEDYCIQRIGDRYGLYVIDNQGIFNCLIDTIHYTEFSNILMDILQVNMPCIDGHGNELNITPPLLFRFQYIDQDEGWDDIGLAFKNMKYIRKWKENTNKYVSGYLADDYYLLKKESTKKETEIKDARSEFTHVESFVGRIGELVDFQLDMSPDSLEQSLDALLETTDSLRKKQFETHAQIARTENQLFVLNQQYKVAKHNQVEAKKDACFAMTQEDTIVCPVCGAEYDNGIEKQLHIAEEYAKAENLISYLEKEIKHLKEQLVALKEKIQELSNNISINEKQILTYTEQLSYRSFFVDEGKRDVYLSCKKELEALNAKVDELIAQKSIIDNQISKIKSRKKAKEIRDEIVAYCGTVADHLNVSRTFIRLKDFVQEIDRSGSDTPRLVYMYHVALYLYNLKRANSPFNFLVVDTPNQQGQDEDNLTRIFNSLELLTDSNGQVIIGTERATGRENKASNVIRLTEKRRCLNSEHYQEHLLLSQNLLSLGANWIHEKHLRDTAEM